MRDEVPPEVFTTPYTNPVGGSAGGGARNLREALRLLKEAGYERALTAAGRCKTGNAVHDRTAGDDPSFERVMLFFKPSLERLGIDVSVRTIDDAQYENRLRSWDFDIVVSSWGESLSPGNEQREYWGSQAADMAGSRNLVGIKNPTIDKLIERVIFARDRDDLRRGDQGARPRAAVESLCRAAVDLSTTSGPRAGTASVGRRSCRNTASRLSPHVVVRRRQGRRIGKRS